jgi:hypothetical protein
MVMTISGHIGEHWKNVPFRPRGGYVVGVDPGQSVDPTAIAVLDWQRCATDTWRVAANGSNVRYQQSTDSFRVRHLERLPLGMNYIAVAEHIRQMLQRSPLNQNCVEVVVDTTRVGRAVADIMQRERIPMTRITITAGTETTHNGDDWHVPKIALVSALDARLNTGELKIAEALSESPALREELKEFRRHVSDAGRSTYAARAGAHDDLVLAVAMTVFWATRPSEGEHSCGFVMGMA